MMNKKEHREKIMVTLKEHYNKAVEMGYEVLGVFLYGSQNYGLDTSMSDIDSKIIILPSIDDIVLRRKPVSTSVEVAGGLTDIKDIRVMFEIYKKANINFLETLFTNYYILNTEYVTRFTPMWDRREEIANFNLSSMKKAIFGMAKEKQNALFKEYPSQLEQIKQFGYSGKQLHHILRLKEFSEDFFLKGKSFLESLTPSHKEELIDIKTYNPQLTTSTVETMAEMTISSLRVLLKDEDKTVNIETGDFMDSILSGLIRQKFRNEILAENENDIKCYKDGSGELTPYKFLKYGDFKLG